MSEQNQRSPAINEELDQLHKSLSVSKFKPDLSTNIYTNINTYLEGYIKNDTTGDFLNRIDLRDYWKHEQGLRSPAGYNWLTALSKASLAYPQATFKTRLPDLVGMAGNPTIQLGLGGTDYGQRVAFTHLLTGGVEELRTVVYNNDTITRVNITDLRPATYKTGLNYYSIKLNRGMAEFYINRVLVGVAMPSPVIMTSGPLPYAVIMAPFSISTHGIIHVEAETKGSEELTLPMNLTVGNSLLDPLLTSDAFSYLDFFEGEPTPPRIYSLYYPNTLTTFTGSVIAAGAATSYTVPTFGYNRKSVYFRADQAGTLNINTICQSENFRTYDSVQVLANTLHVYTMTAEALAIRVVFTPNAYPCTVSEAEVDLG